jgi:DNA-binding transcriptional regulator YiaG
MRAVPFSKALTPLNRPPSVDAMAPEELHAILDDLGLSANAAARLLGVNERTARRWSAKEAPIPPTVARFLRYLHRTKASPQEVMEILGAGGSSGPAGRRESRRRAGRAA